MKFLLMAGPLAGSAILLLLAVHPRIRLLLHVLAYICAYIFGAILSITIYEVRRNHTVFMTEVHEVLLNEVFLLCGAYLGAYGLYMLLRLIMEQLRA
ncbi:hypothetical protein [Ectobacillus ponti]|uniref:Uncharacterized protein n=1 Tax=Ectobacillus ponti TaxID=2961894 RepID=A0AA41X9M5_9BACI|nr:hypothetical protein [Ectobacillus ponti]MCP8968910.1 hypothetical protein [Ectobacillus ponti]